MGGPVGRGRGTLQPARGGHVGDWRGQIQSGRREAPWRALGARPVGLGLLWGPGELWESNFRQESEVAGCVQFGNYAYLSSKTPSSTKPS